MIDLFNADAVPINDPEAFVPPLLSPRWAPVCAFPPVRHGLLEVPECLLLYDGRPSGEPPELAASFGELTASLGSGRYCLSVCSHAELLYGQVPHIPGVSAERGELLLLLARRIQPVPGHDAIVPCGTLRYYMGYVRIRWPDCRSPRRPPRIHPRRHDSRWAEARDVRGLARSSGRGRCAPRRTARTHPSEQGGLMQAISPSCIVLLGRGGHGK